MATEPKIQRVKPLTIRDVRRRWMMAYGTGDTALAAQEIITTSDQKRLWRGDGTLLSGGVDHGTVATDAALATIYLLPGCTRGVWPGDTAWVTSAGCEYRCISGSNATAVWRAVGAGTGASGTATFAGISGEPGDNAALAAALDGKAATTHGHPLSQLAQSGATDGQVPAWSVAAGAFVPITPASGGGGYIGVADSLDDLLAAEAPIGATAKLSGYADRLYMCIGTDSTSAQSWVWWETTSAYTTTARRFIRLHSTVTAGTYLDIANLRYRAGGVWYPTVDMTAVAAPSPLVASMDSVYGGAYPAWQAFDSSSSSRAASEDGTGDHWIKLDLGEGNEIAPDAFKITNTNSRYPSSCVIEGSDTGEFAGEQITYYSHSGLTTGWTNDVERVFEW